MIIITLRIKGTGIYNKDTNGEYRFVHAGTLWDALTIIMQWETAPGNDDIYYSHDPVTITDIRVAPSDTNDCIATLDRFGYRVKPLKLENFPS